MDVAAGDHIGGYQLIAPLGSGGFATVWDARPLDGGLPAAVKVLRPKYFRPGTRGEGPAVVDRFFAEARLLSRMRHPGLVRIHTIIDDPQRRLAAYVMERLSGVELSEVYETLDLPAILDVFARVTDTLEYVHDHGIVHRDIKPGNIMICRREGARAAGEPEPPPTVKLIDFGTAKHHGAQSELPNHTMAGPVTGTLVAMAPEMFERARNPDIKITGAADQWSVGVALYWCIAGHPPFQGNPAHVIRAILDEAPPRPTPGSHLRIERVPRALEDILMRCMEKDPLARYPTAGRLTAALRAVAADLPPARGDSLTKTVALDHSANSLVLPVRYDSLDMATDGALQSESLLTDAGGWGPGDSEAPTVRLAIRRRPDDES